MHNHDKSPSTPTTPSMNSSHDFDLRRVAVFFRRSLSKDVIEQEVILETAKMENETDDMGHVGVKLERPTSLSTECTNAEEDISLADYVEAYNELNKMFPKLGRLFSFIASDVGDKTNILSEHLQSPDKGEKYEMIGKMLDYEKNEVGILPKNGHHPDYSNGSRNLLRLHRALLFVVHFIEGIRHATDQEKMSQLARKAYDDTLAKHHPWLVRQGVHLAVHTLPNRHQLLSDLAGSNVATEEAEKVMEETAAAGRAVYDIVQKLYEKHQLLDLP